MDDNKLEQSDERFADAVRTFVQKRPSKYASLLRLQNGITELRSKKASYRTIRDLLQSSGITVSLDTVARFCREIVERRQARPIKRKAHVRTASEKMSEGDKSPVGGSPERPSEECSDVVQLIEQRRNEAPSDAATSLRKRGPRIADPKNV